MSIYRILGGTQLVKCEVPHARDRALKHEKSAGIMKSTDNVLKPQIDEEGWADVDSKQSLPEASQLGSLPTTAGSHQFVAAYYLA